MDLSLKQITTHIISQNLNNISRDDKYQRQTVHSFQHYVFPNEIILFQLQGTPLDKKIAKEK